MTNAEIRDVSDTALWVAAHRALESQRPDAAFHDPLAEGLVGERGHALRQMMPGSELMQWVMVLRTVAIDRLVQRAIALGADTVINLGAGLDTRPYRLALPPSLRWIEIDLPNIIELKTMRLHSHTPACRLEHIALDLSNREHRWRTLADIASQSQSIVVLSEGLLLYLEPEDVASLTDELHQLPNVTYWIQDYYNGQLRGGPFGTWRDKLKAAPFKFQPPDWIGYFNQHDWAVLERTRLVDEARRLGRRPPMPWWRMLLYAFMPPAMRRKQQERVGYVMFERSAGLSP